MTFDEHPRVTRETIAGRIVGGEIVESHNPYGSFEYGRRHPWWRRLWWRVSPRCLSAHFPAGVRVVYGNGCSLRRGHPGRHHFDRQVAIDSWWRP